MQCFEENEEGMREWPHQAKPERVEFSPASIDPLRCCNRSAHAPLIVAAAIASAGDIFICVHARDRTNGMLGVGEEPGLKSVATATATPDVISFRAGGKFCMPRE